MARTDVILLTGGDTIHSFQNFYDKSVLQFAGGTSNAADLINLVSRSKNAVVVIDTVFLDESGVSASINLLNEKGIKFITICINAQEGFSYLNRGALDMLIKNQSFEEGAKSYIHSICLKIKSAVRRFEEENTRTLKYNGEAKSNKIVFIGSSTGGTETVLQIMMELPINMPPILIVQHMPPVFTRLYAERLDGICKMSVREAKNGDILKPGLALIAPGDLQMEITGQNNSPAVNVYSGEKVNGHAPSVDTLFYSAAKVVGKKAIGVILTGMGADGAKGLLEMRKNGAFTIGQDESTSVVYGMPKVAYELGAVVKQAKLSEIAQIILENL